MPHRVLLSFIEPLLVMGYNTTFLVISMSPLSIILFIIGFLWQVSKLKREVEKYHKGSFKSWFKWLVKKN